MIYLIVLIILLIGVFKYERKNFKIGYKWYILEWLLLVLLAGLRYKIGGDTASYMGEFDHYPSLSELSSFNFTDAARQPLWYVFTAICKSISQDFVCVQIVHALIVNTVFFWFFKTHSERCFSCVLIYGLFFFMNYNTEVLRASLAVSVFLISYNYLVQKKWIKYFICCFIALGFHLQSILLFIFPVCHYFEKSSFIRTLVIAFFTVSAILLLDFVPVVGDTMQLMEDMSSLFESYASADVPEKNILGILSTSINVACWIVFLYLMGERKDINRFFIFMIVVCGIASWKYRVIFDRSLVFVYPMVITSFVKYFNKRNFLTIILYLTIMWGWVGFYRWREGPNFRSYRKYYPYATWIDKTEDPERNAVAGRGIW